MLVIKIENVADYEEEDFTRQDMTRWFRGKMKHHRLDGELLIEVAYPKRTNLYEGVKRLSSFGIKSHVVRRKI